MPKTTQSVEYTAQVAAAANFSSRIDDKRNIGGSVDYARIKVTMDATNVAGDVITLLELPAGAVVLPELSSFIVTDDCTTGALTIHVGDVLDPDRYCVSANCATPGVIPFILASATTFPVGLAARTLVNKSRDAALNTSLVTMTLATFTATIEAGEIYVNLAYKNL